MIETLLAPTRPPASAAARAEVSAGWTALAAAALLCFTLWLRFQTLHGFLVGGDPQDRVAEAIRISQGDLSWVSKARPFGILSFGKPPLYAFMLAAAFRLTGDATVETAHAATLAVSSFVPLAAFLLALRLTRRRGLALLAGLGTALAPAVLQDAHLIGYEQPFAVFAALALERLAKFWEEGSRPAYAAGFALAVLSAYTYIMGVGVLLAALGLGALRMRLRLWPYVAAFAALWLLFPFDIAGESYFRYFSYSRALAEPRPWTELLRARALDYLGILLHWESVNPDRLGWLRSAAALAVPLLFLFPRRWYLIAFMAGYLAPYLAVTGANISYMVPFVPVLLAAWAAGAQAMLRRAPRLGTALPAAALAFYALTAAPQAWGHVRLLRENPDALFDKLLRAEDAFAWLRENAPVGSRVRVGLYSHEFYIALHDRFALSGFADGFVLNGTGTYSLSDLLDRPEEIRAGAYAWILFAMTDYVLIPDGLELQRRGYTEAVDRDFFALLEKGAFARDFRVARVADLPYSRGERTHALRVLRVERIGPEMRRPPVTLP